MSNRRVILASGSPQRRIIFSALNIPFDVVPADVDEKAIRDVDLSMRAEHIARLKTEHVEQQYPDAIVIGGDTFVGIGDDPLEKPVDIDEARVMLQRQSGQSIQVYTGFCYIDREKNIDVSLTKVIQIRFRDMSDVEIEAYVTTLPVTTWSAAFSTAYPYGASLIAEMNGSYTGFSHGLPMEEVVPLLRASGIEIGGR